MTLVLALGVAVLFGCGAYLMLQPDLIRLVAGMVLISNAATLFVMASGLTRGEAPIDPPGGATVSDPLVQAMAITALVIGFAVTALLLALVFRVHQTHNTVDLDELMASQGDRGDRTDVDTGDRPLESDAPEEDEA